MDTMTNEISKPLPLVYCQQCGSTMNLPRLPMSHESVFCGTCGSPSVLISEDNVNFAPPFTYTQRPFHDDTPQFYGGFNTVDNFASQDYNVEPELRSPMSPNPQSAAIKDEMRRRSWVIDSLRAQFEEVFQQEEAENWGRQAMEQEYEDRGFNNIINHPSNNETHNKEINHMENITEEDEIGLMQEHMKDTMSTLKEIRRRSQFMQFPQDFSMFSEAENMGDAVDGQQDTPGQFVSDSYNPMGLDQEAFARQTALQQLDGTSQAHSMPQSNTNNQHYSSYNNSANGNADIDLASLQAAISSPSITRAILHNANSANPTSMSASRKQPLQQPQQINSGNGSQQQQYTNEDHQIFATEEQAEQFRVRRMELAQDADQIERERMWRMTGGLGILGNGSQVALNGS